MRTIRFRGKRLDNGEWVYGYLCENGYGEICIQEKVRKVIDGFTVLNRLYIINTNTIGQYTGLDDVNGKEIYEGDILLRKCLNPDSCTNERIEYKSQVYFSTTTNPSGWRIKNSTKTGGWSTPLSWSKLYNNQAVVIGNIYDNPELLKGGKK